MQYLCNEIRGKLVFDYWLDTFRVIRYTTVDFSAEQITFMNSYVPTVANNARGMWVDIKFEFIFSFCYRNGDYFVSKNVYISCRTVQTQDLSDDMHSAWSICFLSLLANIGVYVPFQ